MRTDSSACSAAGLLIFIVLSALAMPADAGCACGGGGGGGGGGAIGSYDFLGDPAFSGMMTNFQDLMNNMGSVKVGAAALGDAAPAGGATQCPVDAAEGSENYGHAVEGDWIIDLGSMEVDLALVQSDSYVYGRGLINNTTEMTASGSIQTDGVLSMYLMPLAGDSLYRLELAACNETLSGSYEAMDALGESKRGNVIGVKV